VRLRTFGIGRTRAAQAPNRPRSFRSAAYIQGVPAEVVCLLHPSSKENTMSSAHAVISYRSWSLALCTAGTLLGASAAMAAAGGSVSDAQRIYQADRAACIRGDTGQDRATCLREAAAALQEAKRGRLDDGQAQFEQNRLLRCEKQPAEDRQDCIRRMNGEGTTSGSVKGGGIYRELVVPVPAPSSN
jgi:hypothetical protein